MNSCRWPSVLVMVIFCQMATLNWLVGWIPLSPKPFTTLPCIGTVNFLRWHSNLTCILSCAIDLSPSSDLWFHAWVIKFHNALKLCWYYCTHLMHPNFGMCVFLNEGLLHSCWSLLSLFIDSSRSAWVAFSHSSGTRPVLGLCWLTLAFIRFLDRIRQYSVNNWIGTQSTFGK